MRGVDKMDIPTEIERLSSLLQGGRPPRSVRLSSRQLKSLTALCDALIPSSEAPDDAASRKDIARFYGSSASNVEIPQLVSVVNFSSISSGFCTALFVIILGRASKIGNLISLKELHPDVWILRMVLWFFSTWYGTFAICGGASLSRRFPYFRKVTDVEEKKREEILLQLSRSSLGTRRSLFQSLKTMTLRLYFQRVRTTPGFPIFVTCSSVDR